MGGIEEEVGFGGDDDAGELEDGRSGCDEPGVADGACAWWGGVGAPIFGKSGGWEALDEAVGDSDGDGEVVLEEEFRGEMDEHFEGGEGL